MVYATLVWWLLHGCGLEPGPPMRRGLRVMARPVVLARATATAAATTSRPPPPSCVPPAIPHAAPCPLTHAHVYLLLPFSWRTVNLPVTCCPHTTCFPATSPPQEHYCIALARNDRDGLVPPSAVGFDAPAPAHRLSLPALPPQMGPGATAGAGAGAGAGLSLGLGLSLGQGRGVGAGAGAGLGAGLMRPSGTGGVMGGGRVLPNAD